MASRKVKKEQFVKHIMEAVCRVYSMECGMSKRVEKALKKLNLTELEYLFVLTFSAVDKLLPSFRK